MLTKLRLVCSTFSVALLFTALVSCQKQAIKETKTQKSFSEIGTKAKGTSSNEHKYNLEIVLKGESNQSGHIHFRQDRDAAKDITLNTKLHHLKPHHTYFLQRADDQVLDGECTGAAWLTLGYGLQTHALQSDEKGNAAAELWRDVTAIASGSTFDIHFRVLDAVTTQVVLTSGCYQYTVR